MQARTTLGARARTVRPVAARTGRGRASAGVAAAGTQDSWEAVDRVVAVGDVHGDHEQFVTVLRDAGLVDARLDWVGGGTHLVQTGDRLDRGAESRKVMDLLMRLEKQAKKAGGRVRAWSGATRRAAGVWEVR